MSEAERLDTKASLMPPASLSENAEVGCEAVELSPTFPPNPPNSPNPSFSLGPPSHYSVLLSKASAA